MKKEFYLFLTKPLITLDLESNELKLNELKININDNEKSKIISLFSSKLNINRALSIDDNPLLVIYGENNPIEISKIKEDIIDLLKNLSTIFDIFWKKGDIDDREILKDIREKTMIKIRTLILIMGNFLKKITEEDFKEIFIKINFISKFDPIV